MSSYLTEFLVKEAHFNPVSTERPRVDWSQVRLEDRS